MYDSLEMHVWSKMIIFIKLFSTICFEKKLGKQLILSAFICATVLTAQIYSKVDLHSK